MKFAAIFIVVFLFAMCHQGHGARILSNRFWNSVHSLVDRDLAQAAYAGRSTALYAISRYFNGGRRIPPSTRFTAIWSRASNLVNAETSRYQTQFHSFINHIWVTVKSEHDSLESITLRMSTTFGTSQMIAWDLVDNILGSLGEYFKVASLPIGVEEPTKAPITTTTTARDLRTTVSRVARPYPRRPYRRIWEPIRHDTMERDVLYAIHGHTDRINMYLNELVDALHSAASIADRLLSRHPEWTVAVKKRMVSTVFDADFERRNITIMRMLRANKF